MKIISNGSKWAGQAPDTLDDLIAVLGGTAILDPVFQKRGNHFVAKYGQDYQAFGNFTTVSHVFDIRGNREEMLPLIQAIRRARKKSEYRELVRSMRLGRRARKRR